MAGNASGLLPDVSSQAKVLLKDRIDGIVAELDLVPRTEFERVEMIAIRARERQEHLEKRVAELEKKLQARTTKTAKATKRTKK